MKIKFLSQRGGGGGVDWTPLSSTSAPLTIESNFWTEAVLCFNRPVLFKNFFIFETLNPIFVAKYFITDPMSCREPKQWCEIQLLVSRLIIFSIIYACYCIITRPYAGHANVTKWRPFSRLHIRNNVDSQISREEPHKGCPIKRHRDKWIYKTYAWTTHAIINGHKRLNSISYILWCLRSALWKNQHYDWAGGWVFSTKLHVRKAKTQTSLCIRTGWPEYSLSAWTSFGT